MSAKIACSDVSFFYGSKRALSGIHMDVRQGEVLAFIGPSGCGKSTFLRCFNRMNDTIEGTRVQGTITLDGEDIYARGVDVVRLRRRVGMVFQKPNPFPKSIFENVAYGLRIAGERSRSVLDGKVEQALRDAALFDEVADDLSGPAMGLSGGQQQRLCIARALAIQPEVVLMDEPTSALDPIATGRIEELIGRLRGRYTVVIVTHNMAQARRIADRTAVFYLGELCEVGDTSQIFEAPIDPRTRDYVRGVFG